MTEFLIELKNALPKDSDTVFVQGLDETVGSLGVGDKSGVVCAIPADGEIYPLPPIGLSTPPREVLRCSISHVAGEGYYVIVYHPKGLPSTTRGPITTDGFALTLKITKVQDGILIVGTIDIFPDGE